MISSSYDAFSFHYPAYQQSYSLSDYDALNSHASSPSASYSGTSEDVDMASATNITGNNLITSSTSNSSDIEDISTVATQKLEECAKSLTKNSSISLSDLKAGVKKPAHAGIKKSGRSKKQGRTVWQTADNGAPSVSNPSGKFDPELAKSHGELRLQLLYAHFLALYKTAVRSDENAAPYNLHVDVGHARYQDGQGQKNKNTHAAHAHPAAGTFDNWRDEAKTQSISECQVTPLKRAILQAKGFSDADIAFLEDPSKTAAEKSAHYDSILHKKYAEESLLDGTELMRQLNATNELPVALNLKCDKALENKLRPHLAELFKQVMLGELTPEEAINLTHALIVEHFDTLIPLIQKKVDLVNNYVDSLDFIKNQGEKVTHIQLIDHVHEMDECQKELSQSQTGLAKTHLSKNKSFLAASLKRLDNLPGSKLNSFNKWFIKKYDALKDEAVFKLGELKKLLEFNVLEKEGSILPPFELLSGNYNPVTQQIDPLSQQELRAQQLQLLAAISLNDCRKTLQF